MGELARVFTDAKRVDSRALNLAGVQLLRAALARILYQLRNAPDDPFAAELSSRGFAVRENFLAPGAFAATVREAEIYVHDTLPGWLHQHGTTTVSHYSLANVDPARFPQLSEWRLGARTLEWAAAAERRPLVAGAGSAMIEDVRLGDYSVPDPQSALHIDAVFNTHKIWLYLDDVTEYDGPLVYVPGSHHLDGTRLLEEYRDSIMRNRCIDPSRRVGEREVLRRGLERRVLVCARNTLVIANTSGYHCRAAGHPGASRRALHMSFRFNPFRYPMPRVRRTVRAAANLVRRRD